MKEFDVKFVNHKIVVTGEANDKFARIVKSLDGYEPTKLEWDAAAASVRKMINNVFLGISVGGISGYLLARSRRWGFGRKFLLSSFGSAAGSWIGITTGATACKANLLNLYNSDSELMHRLVDAFNREQERMGAPRIEIPGAREKAFSERFEDNDSREHPVTREDVWMDEQGNEKGDGYNTTTSTQGKVRLNRYGDEIIE